jgi:hypothetical protein
LPLHHVSSSLIETLPTVDIYVTVGLLQKLRKYGHSGLITDFMANLKWPKALPCIRTQQTLTFRLPLMFVSQFSGPPNHNAVTAYLGSSENVICDKNSLFHNKCRFEHRNANDLCRMMCMISQAS